MDARPTTGQGTSLTRRELFTILLIAAIQLVNIVDFMMVMPLGPDFSRSLGIPVSELGTIGGSYTAAASIAGLLGSLFLDRFDRKKALLVAMAGLTLGTFTGSQARGLGSLVLARVIAGAFGGPATSLSYSIIADVVPPERRGRAMGIVMVAFGVASVFGVPLGLELAFRFDWRAPFVALAVVSLVVTTIVSMKLPPMTTHLGTGHGSPIQHLRGLVRTDVMVSYAMTFCLMLGSFIVIPNISAYVLYNVHYPREHLGVLYASGGAVSIIATPFIGRIVDRFGSARVGSVGSLAMTSIIFAGFARFPPLISPLPTFVLFMLSSSLRNVSCNTLTTKVPHPDERASFASVQSAVQHMAAACGAFSASRILSETASHELVGMSTVATISIAISFALPPLLFAVEARLRRRDSRAPAPGVSAEGSALPASGSSARPPHEAP